MIVFCAFLMVFVDLQPTPSLSVHLQGVIFLKMESTSFICRSAGRPTRRLAGLPFQTPPDPCSLVPSPLVPGQLHERHWSVLRALCTAPTGLTPFFAPGPHASTPGNKDRFLGTPVKRGANNHCASGATPIGTRSVNKFNSCDCPALVPSPRPLLEARLAILDATAFPPMTNQMQPLDRPHRAPSTLAAWALLAAIFAAVQFASLFTPPLLDDADASHAQAAQHMAESGDWVTLKVNGIRYLEKPPLPYWLVAGLYRVFGQNVFATHLPNALAMLGCAWLAWLWARRAWGAAPASMPALGVLTSIGPFLFTRFTIPEALLSFLSAVCSLLPAHRLRVQPAGPLLRMWAALALAAADQGPDRARLLCRRGHSLLLLTGQWRRWRRVEAGYRPAALSGHRRALAHSVPASPIPTRATPWATTPPSATSTASGTSTSSTSTSSASSASAFRTTTTGCPLLAYWLLHLVWLFPWSLFLPALLVVAWKTRRTWLQHLRRDAGQTVDFYLDNAVREDVASYVSRLKFRVRTIWLLSLFAGLHPALLLHLDQPGVLHLPGLAAAASFSLPACWPASRRSAAPDRAQRPALLSTAWLTGAQAVFAVVWRAGRRGPGLGTVGVAQPALRLRHRHSAGASRRGRLHALHVALLRPDRPFVCRAAPARRAGRRRSADGSGRGLAAAAQEETSGRHRQRRPHLGGLPHRRAHRLRPLRAHAQLQATGRHHRPKRLARRLLHHLRRPVGRLLGGLLYAQVLLRQAGLLVVSPARQHGEGSSLLWGSCYPDAPKIFLSEDELSKIWGTGERKWLFAQDINQSKAEQLLAGRLYPVQSIADKALWTDRPLK